ncbi:MAG: tetratricopeptide repeat protein [Gemmatimonadaceae bacterium]
MQRRIIACQAGPRRVTRSPIRIPRRAALPFFLLVIGSTGSAAQEEQRTTDSLLTRARSAARDSRNAESAKLFRAVLDREPNRARDVLREYADQLTYSGRAREAIPLYRQSLGYGTSASDSLPARLGLALALSRSDQLQEAESEYERILRLYPGNVEATKGRARVLVWRGRHRAAQAQLRALLSREPADRDAALLLAQSQHWSGRSDRALKTLDGPLAQHPDGRRLLEEIHRSQAAATRLTLEQSRQSDDLEIAAGVLQHSVPLSGQALAEFRLEQRRFSPRGDPAGDTKVTRPSIYGRRWIGEALELNIAPGLELITQPGLRDGATTFVYDSWLTIRPADYLRLDVSSNRSTFDNVRSLQKRIAQTSGGASADYLPDELTRLTGRVIGSRFTDGNTRSTFQVEAERQVIRAPHFYVGARGERIAFERQLDNGYFNPLRYGAVVATGRAWNEAVAGRAWWNIDGSWGREAVNPGENRPRWSFGAKLTAAPAKRVEVDARYSYFSSRQLSGERGAGGFSRGTAGVGARLVW